jgi:GNAT superfamily N-acetyltransferase
MVSAQSAIGEWGAVMDAPRVTSLLALSELFATREPSTRAVWTTPFLPDDHYDLSWDTTLYTRTAPAERYFAAHLDDVEVARVLIVPTPTSRLAPAFQLPTLPPLVTEVEWIEVARGHRRLGIGTAVIRSLEQTFAGEHLIAFAAVEAEQFWDATGWHRCDRRAADLASGPQSLGTHSASPRPLHLRIPGA